MTMRLLRCSLWRHHSELFNDLVGYCENICWQIEAQCFRGLEIDHKFNLGGLHYW